MKGRISVIFLLIFSLPFFIMGQRWVDSVSLSGDSLRIHPLVDLTTEGVKAMYLEGGPIYARQILDQAMERDSLYAPANYTYSKLLTYSAPDSAIFFARRAYESDTTNHWYLSQYAQSALQKDDYQLGRQLYAKLVELSPMDLNAYRILSILYHREGMPQTAIALLDTAEMRVGQNPFISNLKRQFLLSTNQVDRAITEAKTMVDEDPFVAESRVSLAELYGIIGRDSLAEVEYDVAMKLDSTRYETLLSLGDFLKERAREEEYLWVLMRIMQSDDLVARNKIGMIREVISDVDRYNRQRMMIGRIITTLGMKHPKEFEVVKLQAQHLISMGMLNEALNVLKIHLNDDPPQMEYYRSVIDVERYLARQDSVVYYLDRAIESFPDEQSLYFELAYMLAAEGEYERAIDSFDYHMESATDSLQSSIWSVVGDLHHQWALSEIKADSLGDDASHRRILKRRLRDVYKSYDKALEYDSLNVMALNNYAYFLSENGGKLKQAMEMSKRSVEVDSNNPTFIDTYAWILYRLGEYDEAKEMMRRAVSFDSSRNYEIALHYGEILYVLGEETMANFYWGKSKEWGASERELNDSRERAKRNFERRSKQQKKKGDK